MIYRTVEVEAEIINSLIEEEVELIDNIVEVDAELSTIIGYSELPTYTGVTSVTPSNQMQVLNTKNTALYDNITINPIPSNYGLITWNGSTLTVS